MLTSHARRRSDPRGDVRGGKLILLRPAGLAVGLAPKEWRYAHVCDSPRTAGGRRLVPPPLAPGGVGFGGADLSNVRKLRGFVPWARRRSRSETLDSLLVSAQDLRRPRSDRAVGSLSVTSTLTHQAFSSDYERLERATEGVEAPFALVDLDAMWANSDDMLRRAAGKPIRVASKSVRSRPILERVLARDPATAGLLTYTLPESLWLAGHGFDDLVVGYPTADRLRSRSSPG